MVSLSDIATLPEWFRRTKAGSELVAEAEAEIDGQRQHAATVIATVEKERDALMPKLSKATADARLALARAKQSVVEAQRALTMAEITELDAHNRFERELATSRSFLGESAPECVRSYLTELLQYYSDIRRSNVQLPEISGTDVPGNMTAGHEQRKRLDERWQYTLVVREFHELVRRTIEDVKAMFGQPITAEQAAKEIEAHRRVIAKARKAAGIL